jgi:hypothetical protein
MKLRALLFCSTMFALVGSSAHVGAVERDVSLDDLPAPARATITKHAADGRLLRIVEDKDRDDGEIEYEARVSTPGGVFEIEVDPRGRLLSKELAD